MSIDTAAKDLASELSHQEYVEVLCHHDADGISAGSIMATALYRAGIPFRLRITHRLSEKNLPNTKPLLLCDLGSGISDLPEDTMVIDHHLPYFEGPYHVNPRIDGIDGDVELCASGAAFMVANALGDNRDLAGLALLGIIGDGQSISGKNQDIYLEAVANGIISKKRGITLPGREPVEQISLSTTPFLKGLSGFTDASEAFISQITEDGIIPPDIFCSYLVFDAYEYSSPETIQKVWGDVWHLEREVIENAYDMAYVIDACGKSGSGSIAASLCLRSSHMVDMAYDLAKSHRMALIQEMNQFLSLPQTHEIIQVFCENKYLASDLADTIFQNTTDTRPVMVIVNNNDGTCSCSIRNKGSKGLFLGEIVHELAEVCGGTGGGHQNRAGATLACEKLEMFVSLMSEACAV